MRDGEAPPFGANERLRRVVACIQARRGARHCRFERTRSLLVAPAGEQHVAAGEPGLRPLGTPLRGGSEGLESFAIAMFLGQEYAKVVVELGTLRRNLERLLVGDDRTVAIARRDAFARFPQQSVEFASHRRLTQPRSRA